MKKCELCNSLLAKLYCESDQALLCWDCDNKVHAANFLVSKHSRSLLCRLCQLSTPWSAAGVNLGTTASICQRCLKRRRNINPESEDEISEEEEEEEETEDGAEEEEENQVVPYSVSSSSQSRTKLANQTAESPAQDDLGSFFSQ